VNDKLIYWGIHTLDRTKANPFPLEHRIWCLQWNLVPEQERKEIIAILAPDSSSKKLAEHEPKEGNQEWTLTLAKPDARIFKYRKYFIFQPNFDPSKHTLKVGSSLLPVNLSFEYFEDETGKPISKIEIYRFKTGEANPVIPFDPQSVLQLGPASIRTGVQINQDNSNTIAHWLEIVVFLANSSWYRSPPALTFRTQNETSEIDSSFPNVGEMHEVALAIRQLYASDQLFNRAVNCHAKICGDSKKVNWVGDIKKWFNNFLDGANSFPMINGVNVRELLDAFLYGGRIVHANEQDKQERLQLLIKTHGRAQVVMAVQTSLRRVVDSARLVLPVLNQDYQHWLEIGKCPKPSLMSMSELLSSAKEQIETPNKNQKSNNKS
jgi:hypothetical protein